jgi:hypothetical protein
VPAGRYGPVCGPSILRAIADRSREHTDTHACKLPLPPAGSSDPRSRRPPATVTRTLLQYGHMATCARTPYVRDLGWPKPFPSRQADTHTHTAAAASTATTSSLIGIIASRKAHTDDDRGLSQKQSHLTNYHIHMVDFYTPCSYSTLSLISGSSKP